MRRRRRLHTKHVHYATTRPSTTECCRWAQAIGDGRRCAISLPITNLFFVAVVWRHRRSGPQSSRIRAMFALRFGSSVAGPCCRRSVARESFACFAVESSSRNRLSGQDRHFSATNNKVVRIKTTRVNTERLTKEHLNGYRYRILKKTPKLTNDEITCDRSSKAFSMETERRYGRELNDITSTADTEIATIGGSNFLTSGRRRRRPMNSHEMEHEISDRMRVRVRSFQAASSIDIAMVFSKVFGGSSRSSSQKAQHSRHPLSDLLETPTPLNHVFGRTNIIIQLPPLVEASPLLSDSVPRYVVVHRFGSVVFFNLSAKDASRILQEVKRHAVDPISAGFERREHYEVALQPSLEGASGLMTADRAMVRSLDMNTVGIVSDIMGQTVALDWYNETVDELLANFSSVNSTVEKTGCFTSMERKTLFQVVARNNALFIDMVHIGIKDRSDTAWHLSQYESLYEQMRHEFDLKDRFKVSATNERLASNSFDYSLFSPGHRVQAQSYSAKLQVLLGGTACAEVKHSRVGHNSFDRFRMRAYDP